MEQEQCKDACICVLFCSGCLFLKVVLKVQASGLQLCLLVLSAVEYQTAVCEGIDTMALSKAHRGEGCARPRLYHINRESGIGLGLSIFPIEGSIFLCTCAAERMNNDRDQSKNPHIQI